MCSPKWQWQRISFEAFLERDLTVIVHQEKCNCGRDVQKRKGSFAARSIQKFLLRNARSTRWRKVHGFEIEY